MTNGGERSGGPSRQEVLRFVERFAMVLADIGWPRMSARVFVFALADDADRYTAGELADALQVSPAAISGAVRWLVQNGLLGKEREPGTRSDQYCLYDDDVWRAITDQRTPLIESWQLGLREGIELIGPERPGGRRLRETLAFFDFMQGELPNLMERWHRHREELFNGTPDDGASRRRR